MKPMKAKDLARRAEAKGWVYSHTDGSHMIYKKKGFSLPIPGPLNREVKAGTVRSILNTIEEVG